MEENRPQRRQGDRLRDLNEQAVLEVVFRDGPISRPEIAERTGLSKPTVSGAVKRLSRAGLVRDAGERRGRPGRVATLYSVDSQAVFVVGVDLGRTKVRAAAANVYGEILAELEQRSDRRGGRSALSQIVRLARRAAADAGADWSQVAVVAVGTPGVVDPASRGISLAHNIPGLGELRPLDALHDQLGVQVLIENDVNLAAVGEQWRGLASEVTNFAFIAVGTGIGMGLVLDGELFRGARGAAGEIAYLPLATDPFSPNHRTRGALEDEASGPGIIATAPGQTGWDASLPGSAEEVFALAREGYAPAREVVAAEARLLGLAVASVYSVVDPELVVLGGGIGSNPLLLEPVRRAAAELLPLPPRIERSALGDRATLYGAVAVALRAARSAHFSRGVQPKGVP